MKSTYEKRKDVREKLTKTVAKLVAENMPPEILYEAIEEGIKASLSEFHVDAWEVKKLLTKIVEEKTTELLRTKYAAELDALAHRAAQSVVK